MKTLITAAIAALALAGAADAAPRHPLPRPAAASASKSGPPTLIVMISVDQFSADLYAEYRGRFTGGMKRLGEGAVFPAGYQSHAATETCPGHSTILTGDHPARTGIIANNWLDLHAARGDKRVYCAEDETVAGSTADNYTVSPTHLKVPTLGDRMKAINPASRVVSVSGKDRAAVMMAGHNPDEIWWWGARSFVSYAGRNEPAIVTQVNARADAQLTAPPPIPLPAACRRFVRPFAFEDKTIGGGAPATAVGDIRAWRTSPSFDADTLAIAEGLIATMKLGRGPAPDLIAIGLSATDYVGHVFGTQGPEMCVQLTALDQALSGLIAQLDRSGVNYVIGLTADHGGIDLVERGDQQGAPDSRRVDRALLPANLGAAIADALKIDGFTLTGDGPFGDFYLSPDLSERDRKRVTEFAIDKLSHHPQVAAVFTGAELAATPRPTRPVDEWTLRERAAASYDPQRSGDLIILLEPRVTPIVDPSAGYVATHGSPWNYDRRVPILFYRPGMTGFEQPLPIETVDIMPTLAALIRLPLAAGEVDGRCLDIDAGAADSCAGR